VPTLSKNKVKDSLRKLINRHGTEAETLDYFQETLTGFGGMGVGVGGNRSDRGAAILLATNLETSLRMAIERKLSIQEKHRVMLFEDEAAPLRDFAAKTRLGYAIGLFGDETKESLDFIRLIRNAFAHAPSPVRFSTAEITNACTFLKVPVRVGEAESHADTSVTGRERFRMVCERIAAALRYVSPSPVR